MMGSWLLALVCAAVVVVLLSGLVVMARGGKFNKNYGNHLMRWRVALQLTAIIIFALLVM